MLEIIDKDGSVIQRSRNLAGIRRYVGRHLVQQLHLMCADAPTSIVPDHRDGELYIIFENGATFRALFGSFAVLKGFVRRWRNVYGAPLWMNGHDAGTVSYHNRNLDGY